jgi:hypothetical protein
VRCSYLRHFPPILTFRILVFRFLWKNDSHGHPNRLYVHNIMYIKSSCSWNFLLIRLIGMFVCLFVCVKMSARWPKCNHRRIYDSYIRTSVTRLQQVEDANRMPSEGREGRVEREEKSKRAQHFFILSKQVGLTPENVGQVHRWASYSGWDGHHKVQNLILRKLLAHT